MADVTEYTTNDSVLPTLILPSPCRIHITIRDGHVYLQVGPRDWQWTLDGDFVGCGTSTVERP